MIVPNLSPNFLRHQTYEISIYFLVCYCKFFSVLMCRILKRVPKNDRKYVEKQLSFLDENFMNYIDYWNEKYYRNGFCDGVQLIIGCESNNIPF